MAAHEVVVKLADQRVSEPFVQLPCARVDRGDAEEDVGELPKDALLGEADQPRSQPAATCIRGDADDLDVADERPLQHENDESPGDAVLARNPHFPSRIGDPGQALFESASEENPRIARRHHLRAGPRLGVAGQPSDLKI